MSDDKKKGRQYIAAKPLGFSGVGPNGAIGGIAKQQINPDDPNSMLNPGALKAVEAIRVISELVECEKRYRDSSDEFRSSILEEGRSAGQVLANSLLDKQVNRRYELAVECVAAAEGKLDAMRKLRDLFDCHKPEPELE